MRKKLGILNIAAIMAYLVGNALTYNHLVKANPSVTLGTSTMLKNLAIACVWPIYWLAELVDELCFVMQPFRLSGGVHRA